MVFCIVLIQFQHLGWSTYGSTHAKEHYGYEVYLRGQNSPSKCCQPIDFWYTFSKDLDLFIL